MIDGKRIGPADLLALYVALSNRLASAIDGHAPEAAAACFVESGRLVDHGQELSGRVEIARYLARRPAVRIACHLLSNFAVTETEEGFHGSSNVLVYRADARADGSLPPMPSPSVLGRYSDLLTLDGSDLAIVERRFTPIFSNIHAPHPRPGRKS